MLLSKFSFSSPSLSWMSSYSSNRMPCVTVGNALSNNVMCIMGVPQGQDVELRIAFLNYERIAIVYILTFNILANLESKLDFDIKSIVKTIGLIYKI